MMSKNVSLVYMVAGMSSRFGGKIKQFAKVGPNNTTLIEYSLQQALPAGFSQIIFIVGKMTQQPFQEMFGDEYQWIPVKYALQMFDESLRDRPWWTVDALCAATDLIDGPFVVCNGDDLYGKRSFQLAVDHIQNSDDAVSIWYVLEKVLSTEWTVNRGVFEIDEHNYITNIIETLNISADNLSELHLSGKELCSMNLFGLPHDVLLRLNLILQDFTRAHEGDRKAECYLPTELATLIAQGNLRMKLYSTPDTWRGVTNPQDEDIVRKQIEDEESHQQ